jgi:coproporphyrinogen III oxidase
MADANTVKHYLVDLQRRIVSELEHLDGQSFRSDSWDREEGGGGTSMVIEKGNLFERGGVNFSHVFGDNLPPSATAARPELGGRSFEAMGVSLVLHPENPFVPTVHLNVRFFIAKKKSAAPVWWFGGGMDLTPYYGFDEDCIHFHATCKKALDAHDISLHAKFKSWCDKYFYLKHRKEPRGIGGIFFDDLSAPDFETCFNITKSVGDGFLEAYTPIIEKRRDLTFTQTQREFQAYRRGRYVEFNLVFDRGTLFGLQSGGRTESILMSMPPNVIWKYDWSPAPGSEEQKLYTNYLVEKNWI